MEKIIPHAAKRSGYRADIDGLRAIAVIGVLVFHINAKAMPGGYLGVDVFFVISGFLITGIIERERLRGSFSFGDFYERRIRRIIPALYAMMALTLVASAVILWPQDFKAFGKSLKYVALSTGNLEFLDAVQDYFSEASDPVPLLHTWSLAVEEQFYFLFPMLLLGLARFGKWKGIRFLVLILLSACSLAAYLWQLGKSPMSAFFLLHYRAWELLAGCMLSLSMPHVLRILGKGSLREVFGWLGLVAVGTGFVAFGGEGGSEGVGAILACAGALLLIATGAGGGTFVSRVLGVKWMTWIGVISYSLYLWHWPLIVFTGNHGGMGWAGGGLVFLASLVLGWASWRLVERPFREMKKGKRRRVFLTWAVLTLAFVICGSYIRAREGVPGRFPKDIVELLEYGDKVPKIRTKDAANPPVFGAKDATPSVALWGDSHARALLPGIEAAATESGAGFQAFIYPGHAPVVGVTLVGEGEEKHTEYTDAVMGRLLDDPSIRTVILAARWSNPIRGMEDIGDDARREFQGHSFANETERGNYYAECLSDVVRRLHGAGKKVYIVDPLPELRQNVPQALARLAYRKMPLPETMPCPDYHKRHEKVIGVFETLEEDGVATRIRPEDDLLKNGEVRIREGKVLFYQDDDHLTPEGAMRLSHMFRAPFADQ